MQHEPEGDCWDNAAVESFFASLKKERIYPGPRYRTRDEGRADIFQYIEGFYNPKRRHSTLGQISPAEFERQFSTPVHLTGLSGKLSELHYFNSYSSEHGTLAAFTGAPEYVSRNSAQFAMGRFIHGNAFNSPSEMDAILTGAGY